MPNIYTVKDFILFSCNVSGTASALALEENICEALSTALGVDVVHTEVSTMDYALIYPIKTEAGAGGGVSCYVRISKANQTITLYACDGTNTIEISHQSATTSGSKGPVLHYIKIGNYVCIGISTGSVKQMDVILDMKNHIIAFNQYNSSTYASVFKFVNSSGNTAEIAPSGYANSNTAVSFASIVVPEFDLIYDDLFLPKTMRASKIIQQYIINDESFFASGNPNTNSSTAPQFVVGEAIGGAA